jgi:type IV secretion system protein VirB10
VINVAVQTAITSDAEGTIIARTLFDVMDTATQSVVLLPAGSILVGNRAQAPTYGQNLIQIGFTQISFPTGALASMKALEGHSLDGSAGIAGEVDHHYLRIFGTALVMAGVATGIQVGANTGQSRGNYYSPASAATNAVSNELGRTANTVLRREFETAPTLTLQQGEEILLVLQDPMEFEAPYNG